jgi:uncharacterized protein YjeT (DUF2065 family)
MAEAEDLDASLDDNPEGGFDVPAPIARLQQGCLGLVGLFLVALGLLEAMTSNVTRSPHPLISVALGLVVFGLGVFFCRRVFRKQTYQLLRTGQLSLLDFFLR